MSWWPWTTTGRAGRRARKTVPPASSTRSSASRLHRRRSEEHTSELQSLMRISYAVLCFKKKNKPTCKNTTIHLTTKKQKNITKHRTKEDDDHTRNRQDTETE